MNSDDWPDLSDSDIPGVYNDGMSHEVLKAKLDLAILKSAPKRPSDAKMRELRNNIISVILEFLTKSVSEHGVFMITNSSCIPRPWESDNQQFFNWYGPIIQEELLKFGIKSTLNWSTGITVSYADLIASVENYKARKNFL